MDLYLQDFSFKTTTSMDEHNYNWEQHNNSKIQFPKKKQTFVNTFKKRFAITISGVMLVVALVVGSYLYVDKTEAVPVVGGTYQEGAVGSPQFINPLLAQTNDANRDITQLTYRSLMTYNTQGELVPDLAESVEVSNDGTQYSFTLKPSLQWSDGEPLNADDVVFTIELVQDQEYKSPFINNWRGVEVRAQDDRTVIMQIQTAYEPFLENATLAIVPKHIWQNTSAQEVARSESYLTRVGSGKYVIDTITHNERGAITSLTLSRNERTQEPKPYIETIVFKFYPSEQEMIQAYNERSIDGMSYISFQNLERVEQDSTVVYDFEFPRYFAVFFNYDSNNDMIKNIAIRKALLEATNKEHIVQNVLGGYGKIATSPIPPSSEYYQSPLLTVLEFSPQQANQTLDSAGWSEKNSNGVRVKDGELLSLTLTVPNTQDLIAVAEAIQEQWRAVGVELSIQKVDVAQLQQSVLPTRNYDMILYGETLGSIVDPYPFWHSSQRQHPGLNIASFNDGTVDTLLEQGRLEQNAEKRVDIYGRLQAYFRENAVALFLYEPSFVYVVSQRIKGVQRFAVLDPAYRFLNAEEWYIKTKRLLTI